MRAILMLSLLTLAARNSSGETPPDYDADIVVPLLGAPRTLDPVRAASHSDVAVASLLFDTLYRAGPTGTAVPQLAAALPQISPDGKTVTVRLRRDVLFHGGQRLAARDVAASLTRAKKTDARWLFRHVRRITAVSDTVRLDLSSPQKHVAHLLALPQAAITRGGTTPSFGKANGTGPFALVAFRRDRGEILLKRFENHFLGPAFVERMTMRWFESQDGEARAYESGETHLSFRGAVAFAGHEPKYKTLTSESQADVLVYVGYGARNAELLENSDFRRAVSLALNRSSFRNLGSGELGVPVTDPLFLEGASPGAPSASLRDARAALARTGRKPGPLEIIFDRSRPDNREVAEKLSASLFRLGLKARVTGLTSLPFAERMRTRDCDFFIGERATASPLPALQIASAFAAGRRAKKAGDVLRGGDWLDTSGLRAFREDLPIIPLYYRSIRAHYRDTVRGLELRAGSQIQYEDVFLFDQAARTHGGGKL